jgi:hypothetical protein
VLSSVFSVERMEALERRWKVVTSRTHAVVSVPAIVRTCASSARRKSRFSWAGSLESRIEWKMVSWARSWWVVLWPDVIFWMCVNTS